MTAGARRACEAIGSYASICILSAVDVRSSGHSPEDRCLPYDHVRVARNDDSFSNEPVYFDDIHPDSFERFA
jgi:hypothetical protein